MYKVSDLASPGYVRITASAISGFKFRAHLRWDAVSLRAEP